MIWLGGESQEGGDICVLMADSHSCMSETNVILQNNSLIKIFKNNQKYFIEVIIAIIDSKRINIKL